MLSGGQFGEVQGDIHRVAQNYMAERGQPPIRGDMSSVVMPRGAHNMLGERHEAAPDFDPSPEAQKSYDALENETWSQLDHLMKPRSKGGMGLSANVTPYDAYGREDKSQPFADHWHNIMRDAAHDVGSNNRIEALSTQVTGGTPSFRNPETNDAFRAVHDVFGHLHAMRGVDRQGEEGAYQMHRQMYSPAARPALAHQLREQVGFQQRFQDFPKQKRALGYDSGPISPSQFGENRSDLVNEANYKNRMQGLPEIGA